MTLELTAPPASPGGPGSAGFTQGSVVFADANGRLNQDNATNYFDGTNKVLILGPRGTYAPTTGELHAVDTTANNVRGIVSYQNDGASTNGARYISRKARGTPSAPTIVVTGDTLGNHIFEGYDGANFLQMASVQAVAEGTIASTRVPTRLVFSTATDAAPSVLTEAMRIDSAQRVGIGGTPSGAQKLLVVGDINVSGPNVIKNANDHLYLDAFTGKDLRFRPNNGTEAGRFATDGSFVIGAGSPAILATGGLTVCGVASQKTAVFRANATTPGNVLELQKSDGTLLVAVSTTAVNLRAKLYPTTDAGASQTAAGIYGGTGAPNNANGADGDIYFRSDGGALTTVYQRRAGAWVGII